MGLELHANSPLLFSFSFMYYLRILKIIFFSLSSYIFLAYANFNTVSDPRIIYAIEVHNVIKLASPFTCSCQYTRLINRRLREISRGTEQVSLNAVTSLTNALSNDLIKSFKQVFCVSRSKPSVSHPRDSNIFYRITTVIVFNRLPTFWCVATILHVNMATD